MIQKVVIFAFFPFRLYAVEQKMNIVNVFPIFSFVLVQVHST
jgi:hypothetical protein